MNFLYLHILMALYTLQAPKIALCGDGVVRYQQV